ncbi:MAG: hypothetical protein ABI197_03950 [Granulicella sp.]
MKPVRIATSILTLALFATTGAIAQYGRPQGPPPPGYGQGPGGWDAPPREYRDFQRRGFQDGLEGARKDLENRRRPNVNNRDEYRNPRVPRNVRRDYRDAFRRGYSLGIQHARGDRGGPGRY